MQPIRWVNFVLSEKKKKKRQERDQRERGGKTCLRLWLVFIYWNNERAYWIGLFNKFLFKLKVNPFILILKSSYKKTTFSLKKKNWKIVLFYSFRWNNINICICPHERYRSTFSDYSKYGRTFKRLSANGHLLTFQIPFCDLNPGRRICKDI